MTNDLEIKRLRRSVLINNLLFVFLVGAILNISVIIHNEGRMPVYYEVGDYVPYLDEDVYFSFTNFDEVNYGFLSDVFEVWIIKFSIGDFIMFISGGLVVGILIHSFFTTIKSKWRKV